MRVTPWILLALLQSKGSEDEKPLDEGFASITEKDLLKHVTELAAPQLEGRDTPSEGLTRAGEYVISRLKAAGIAPGASDTSYRMEYSWSDIMGVMLSVPVPEQCLLSMMPKGGDEVVFTLEDDFVPLPSCPGEGEGPLTFFGFGITESDEKRYDDLKGKNCKGEIVMILESEPRSKKLFDGPAITKAGDVYAKVKSLEERGARGILVVRRSPEEQPKGADGKPLAPTPIGFRYTWALWNKESQQPTREINAGIPVLEINEATATKLLGEDVNELAAKIESGGKPVRRDRKEVVVSLRAGLEKRAVMADNIVGLLRGSDPQLAEEYVVLGAHLDHIGVDGWGRIACGADDNGSGSAGLIELAEALALAKPRRSVLFVWFSGEEDDLLGSKAFCRHPPVPKESIVAMLNMDMIGRLEEAEVWVLGTAPNPAFDDVLKEAKKLRPTQIKKVETGKGQEDWERSDQFSFHQIGIPVLFFFEGAIDADNPDYHTYRDTVERLSISKMSRITRLVFNTAWLIANDPKRPPPPH
jgi:hypothetical protein